jgi:hypothetical protein
MSDDTPVAAVEFKKRKGGSHNSRRKPSEEEEPAAADAAEVEEEAQYDRAPQRDLCVPGVTIQVAYLAACVCYTSSQHEYHRLPISLSSPLLPRCRIIQSVRELQKSRNRSQGVAIVTDEDVVEQRATDTDGLAKKSLGSSFQTESSSKQDVNVHMYVHLFVSALAFRIELCVCATVCVFVQVFSFLAELHRLPFSRRFSHH